MAINIDMESLLTSASVSSGIDLVAASCFFSLPDDLYISHITLILN